MCRIVVLQKLMWTCVHVTNNIIPYETVVCKGEGGSSMALIW